MLVSFQCLTLLEVLIYKKGLVVAGMHKSQSGDSVFQAMVGCLQLWPARRNTVLQGNDRGVELEAALCRCQAQ